jgi:hypothetical protein
VVAVLPNSLYEVMNAAIVAAYQQGHEDGYRTGHADGVNDGPIHKTHVMRVFRDGMTERETSDGRPLPGIAAQIDRRRGFDRGDHVLCRTCWTWWNARILDRHRCRGAADVLPPQRPDLQRLGRYVLCRLTCDWPSVATPGLPGWSA